MENLSGEFSQGTVVIGSLTFLDRVMKPVWVKYIVYWTKMILFPVGGPGIILPIGILLTLVEDVGHYEAWYVVAYVLLLNLLIVRLVCWSLATGLTALLYVTFDKMALHRRFLAMVASLRFHVIWLFAGGNMSENAFSLRAAGSGSFTRRTPRVFTKIVAYGGIVLVQLLYASFSPVAEPSLGHLDPTIFNSFVMLSLVPVALFLLIRWRGELSHAVFVRGALLGVCMGTAFLSLTLALKDTSITQTTVFSCVNGVIATLIAWLILRQRIQMATWGACLFSVAGAALVWLALPTDWQGNFTAFMGGSLLITYAFLVEHLLADDLRTNIQKLWPVLGVQLLTMAGVALAFALCSGDWQTLTMFRPSDALAIGYAGVASTLLPLIISPLALRYVNVITVSFFTVIEPLTSAVSGFALGERLPSVGYIGLGVVLVGVVLQALVGARNSGLSEVHESAVALSQPGITPLAQMRASQLGSRFVGRDSRAILAYLSRAPHGGLDLRSLRLSTCLSYAQLHHLLCSLRRYGYVVVNPDRRYQLHPEYQPSVELLWCA